MRYREEYKLRDIAKALELTEHQVQYQISKIMKKLKYNIEIKRAIQFKDVIG